jgi:ribosomal protein L31
LIEVTKRKPAGVFKTVWYAVDYECHGCWSNCGGGGHEDFDKLDKEVERLKKRFANCQRNDNPSKLPPIVKVVDFRCQQVTLECFGVS